MKEKLTKILKKNQQTSNMKGLCQKCHSSNEEITVVDGIPVCQVCAKNIK